MNFEAKSKIVNGDSLKELKKIPDETFDLVFADPPYNLQLKNEREKIAKYIKQNSTWSLGKASVKEIEKLNILNATLLAMKRAILKLKKKPKLILVDGNKTPEIRNYNLKSVVKGDKKIPSISAASIIAKVSRDRLVKNLSKKFNKYYWETNCGYGTKKHLFAIKKHGITIHHRKTFAPISKLK